VETYDTFADIEDFYLYARDDAYIYGGIPQGMIIARHTPTTAEEELPFNDGNVYRSYDKEWDCIFYDIDCGCAMRKKRKMVSWHVSGWKIKRFFMCR
jgi:serine/threonine protein phosphatase 1